ncbi:MAG: fibronectin type III domain-containing protein [Candidatus Peribacteraceae bacterium]|nr:fibronectin type III domain-containing protein [Candidatus Peribacteraceae bacterium]MDD5074595.1 fibronectin type III domain-containing protein [Candidatus Peribacteraceae bacterium]
MELTPLQLRPHISRTLLLSLLLAGFLTSGASAQDTAAKTTLILRPHCETEGSCTTFTVEDPLTLSTPLLKDTDTLDMDIVLQNPSLKKISRVRAWLLYNPATLEGTTITIGTDLPVAAPGEKDFSAQEGYAKIDVSAEANKESVNGTIVIARVQFTIKTIPPNNQDVLSFYDVQVNGHTTVLEKNEKGEQQNALEQDPGSLLLKFDPTHAAASSSSNPLSSSAASTGSGTASSGSGTSSQGSTTSATGNVCGNGILEPPEQCDDGNFLKGDGCSPLCIIEGASSASSNSAAQSSARSFGTSLPDGSVCAANTECANGLCSSGICRGGIMKVENGGTCNNGEQCLSGSCNQGVCGTKPASSASSLAGQTVFVILQVRNVRLTTQGGTVFLAWDPLVSSQLKSYNVYYGTTSGRYIQRKTVAKEDKLTELRALPEGTTYYFAVRAVSNTNEESAFSQEVAIEVGNAKTSTSPLKGSVISQVKPIKTSDTGLPSALALILLVSAVTGTLFASRRQAVALSHPPRRS